MPDKGLLYHFLPTEIAPPIGVWSSIQDSLDESENQASLTQLSNWEQTPPPQVWDKINASLTEATTDSEFTAAKDMLLQEVNPPIEVWNNIQQALDAPAIKKLLPAKRVARSIWFAAAAAASIGFVFFVTQLLQARKQTKASASNITAIIDTVLPDTNTLKKTGKNITDTTIAFPEATTAFIKVIGPNGDMVKISPKLSPLVEFLDDINGDEPSDKKNPVSAREQMWKQKLVKWDALIYSSADNAATINFADPIALIRFLEKNK